MKTYAKIPAVSSGAIFVLLIHFSEVLSYSFRNQVLQEANGLEIQSDPNKNLDNLPEVLQIKRFADIQYFDELDTMKSLINRYEHNEENKIKSNRLKRGIRRRNYLKRRRVARHKNRSVNSSKQQLKSGTRHALVRGNTETNFRNGKTCTYASYYSYYNVSKPNRPTSHFGHCTNAKGEASKK